MQSDAPSGYKKLPKGARCKCVRGWTDGSDYWCCIDDHSTDAEITLEPEGLMEFRQYRRSQIAELRQWQDGDDMRGVSVSAEDRKAGSPKPGDMIARNPKNHADQWLVAAAYFADNFEPRSTLPREGQGEVQLKPTPYDRVCISDPNNPGARIVGFRIREGDEAWGECGLSEPLFWLDRALSPSPAVRDGVVLVALNADGEERATIKLDDEPWPIAEFIEWMQGWQETDPNRVVTLRALSTQEQGNG